MTPAARRLVVWGLRAGAFALVVAVLAQQLSWWDVLTLDGGAQVVGAAERGPDGWTIDLAPGASPPVPREGLDLADGRVRVDDSAVARTEHAGRVVPEVAWGLRSLGSRVLRHGWVVGLVLVGLVGLVAFTGLRWHLLVRAVGAPLRVGTAVRLTFVGGFFSLVLPGGTGGDVVKAWYAARATGAPTRSVLSVFVDRLVGVLALVLLAAGALLFAARGEGFAAGRLAVLVLLGAIVFLALLALSGRTRRRLGLSALARRLPFQRVLDEIRAGARLYRDAPGVLGVALGMSLVNQAGMAITVWGLARALGVEAATLAACLAFVPLANLLSAAPIAPGGWGVGELAFAWFFGQIGVPATEAVSLSVLYRLGFLAANLPGGPVWLMMRDHASRDRIEAEVEAAAQRAAEGVAQG